MAAGLAERPVAELPKLFVAFCLGEFTGVGGDIVDGTEMKFSSLAEIVWGMGRL